MSRVPFVQKDGAPPEVRDLYNEVEAKGGAVINIDKILAHSPQLLPIFKRLGNTLLTKTKLSPKLRELAILRGAKICGSEYEWFHHYPLGREAGLTHEQTEEISNWSNSRSFSELERAVLQYTDEVAQKVAVTDETFGALRQYLDDQSTVELTICIAYWGLIARILVALQVDRDAERSDSLQNLTGRQE